MATEIAVWGLPAGATERYEEVLLAGRCRDEGDVRKVCAAAAEDGFHSFRYAEIDLEARPDFSRVFRR